MDVSALWASRFEHLAERMSRPPTGNDRADFATRCDLIESAGEAVMGAVEAGLLEVIAERGKVYGLADLVGRVRRGEPLHPTRQTLTTCPTNLWTLLCGNHEIPADVRVDGRKRKLTGTATGPPQGGILPRVWPDAFRPTLTERAAWQAAEPLPAGVDAELARYATAAAWLATLIRQQPAASPPIKPWGDLTDVEADIVQALIELIAKHPKQSRFQAADIAEAAGRTIDTCRKPLRDLAGPLGWLESHKGRAGGFRFTPAGAAAAARPQPINDQ
jgi:Winged helix-turn-helix transcription repressor, HrcA DNA-binding